MSELTFETLAARTTKLERENRMWKMALVFLVLLFVTNAIWKKQPEVLEEIRARHFLVVGVNDEITGRLGPEGLTLLETAANIILRNSLTTDPVGSPAVQPYLTLTGPTGTIRFNLGSLPYQDIRGVGPYVSIQDRNGNVAAELSADQRSLSLYGHGDRDAKISKPSLLLLGKGGKIIWKVP